MRKLTNVELLEELREVQKALEGKETVVWSGFRCFPSENMIQAAIEVITQNHAHCGDEPQREPTH